MKMFITLISIGILLFGYGFTQNNKETQNTKDTKISSSIAKTKVLNSTSTNTTKKVAKENTASCGCGCGMSETKMQSKPMNDSCCSKPEEKKNETVKK